MKTTIGILCIVVPVVAAYWDIIDPAIKKQYNKITTLTLHHNKLKS